ncbi:MAG: methyl-accepting chemotaxis protein [Bdellovibrionales bacterium]|jgi:methyl-accepting chemotaxis protein
MPAQSKLFFLAIFWGGAFLPLCTTLYFAPEDAFLKTAPLLVLALAGISWLGARRCETTMAKEATTLCTAAGQEKTASLLAKVALAQSGLVESAKSLVKLTDDHQQRATNSTSSAALATESATGIASAIEEMNSAIVEIGRQADEASSIARGTAEKAKAADGAASALSDQSDQILSIVELIREIAGRTNLLALNATIEAARAGEHGKGFAVVASEVKSLAQQTANATTQIEAQINTVRESSHAMKAQMNAIESAVDQMNAITGAIKSALHEESAATQEIARGALQTTTATTAVTNGISHMLVTTEEIRRASTALGEEASSLTEKLKEPSA